MRQSSLIAYIGGILAASGIQHVVAPEALATAFKPPRVRFHGTSKRYPEQSSRQAMRGHRRAQGGPGIVLDQSTHRYKAAIPHDLWF